MKPPELRAQPVGWLSRWAGSLGQRGCLSPGDGAKLAAQVAEAVPLEPGVASSLLHDPGMDFVDLDPGSRVLAVAPLFREGTKAGARAIESASGSDPTLTVRSSPDLLGVETAWYAIEAYLDRPGAHVVFLAAEDREGERVTHPEQPRLDYLHFAPNAAYYRLFTITRRSRSNHDMMVLAASTSAELERETKRLEADPSACAEFAEARACIEVPRDTVLTRVPVVTANGARVPVQGRGTVRDVLMSAGVKQPAGVLSTLHIERDYLGHLVPVSFEPMQGAILDLSLSGGEVLRW